MRSLSLASAVLLLVVLAPLVCANTITVTGTGDSLANNGVCTLREAIINANNNAATWSDCAAGSGADVINLPAGTITLTINGRNEALAATGDLDITDSLTINGNAAGTIVNGGGVDRVFDVDDPGLFNPPLGAISVTFNNFTITGGSVQGDGGGVRVDTNGSLAMNGMTITGNGGNNDGGGVKVEGSATLTMTNCTVSGNSISLLYGGIRNDGTLTITSCTITNNHGLGGRGQGVGSLGVTNLRNTIIAGNGAPEVEGSFTSNGYNIIGNLGLATITATTGDQFGVNPSTLNLGALQNNGGPTSTHALGAGSIAIDQGDSSGSSVDQRGLPRPCDDSGIANASGGDGADVGAFEVQGCAANHAPVANDDNATVNEDSSNNLIDVLANDTDSDGDTLTITTVTQGSNGSVTNNSTDVSYTPAPLFFGSDSFTYTISDGHGGTSTATVHVTVNHVNHPPHANPDSYSVNQNTVLAVAAPGVLANDTDVDVGDTLHAVLVSPTSHGSLTLHADGSFTYTPNPGFACTDSFTYKANDGTADSNVTTVTISVIDTEGPSISISTSATTLWPPNHDLVNVGLSFGATDNGCSGSATTSVEILSDEDDVTSGGGEMSPDAKGMLFLRAERDGSSDGRVYLIRVTATDASNNTSHGCAAVVVPHSMSAADVASVNAQAANAVSQCSGSGFFVVGDGPVIGPKQ